MIGTNDFSAFQQVEVRVGVIVSVEEAEEVRVRAWRLWIDFGA